MGSGVGYGHVMSKYRTCPQNADEKSPSISRFVQMFSISTIHSPKTCIDKYRNFSKETEAEQRRRLPSTKKIEKKE